MDAAGAPALGAVGSDPRSRCVANGTLRTVAVAPHNYRGACCVGNSAVLYQKAS